MEIAEKLNALLELQAIDSQLDELRKLRGDLPEEVRDLEDELIGIETRLKRFKSDIESLESEIAKHRLNKKDADKLIAKYKEQQMNVRNNREFDAISKELEGQELEIQLADRRIRETEFKIREKEEEMTSIQIALDSRKIALDVKKKELEKLIAESKEDEIYLIKQSY